MTRGGSHQRTQHLAGAGCDGASAPSSSSPRRSASSSGRCSACSGVRCSWVAFTERDYAAIVFSFPLARSRLLLAGRVMDKLGTRRGFAVAVGVWASQPWRMPRPTGPGTALSNSSAGRSTQKSATFAPSIVLLLGAAAGFGRPPRWAWERPATSRPPSRRSPSGSRQERALATGIFTRHQRRCARQPLVVPWIVSRWGWRWAFHHWRARLPGVLAAALSLTADHPARSARADYIRSDPPDPPGTIVGVVFPHRQTWAFALGSF
jgi:ACS family hexuronate transporter-like MFS transporter